MIHLLPSRRSTRALPALVGILGEAVRTTWSSAGGARQVGWRPAAGRRHDDGRNQSRGGVSLEGAAAGQHLVEDAPERKDVGSGVHVPPLELLRRHVMQGAEDGPCAVRGRASAAASRSRRGPPGEWAAGFASPKSSSLAPPPSAHVCRLQIAVDDAMRGERRRVRRRLSTRSQRLVERQRPSAPSRAASVSPSSSSMTRKARAVAARRRHAPCRCGMRQLRDRARFAIETFADSGWRQAPLTGS